MLASLLLVGASLLPAQMNVNPRAARTLGSGSNPPWMAVAWQASANGTSIIQGSAIALSSIPAGLSSPPSPFTFPQETLTTVNGTFTAASPLSPDVDLDEGHNTVTVWVAQRPYDPKQSAGPNGNDVYLSYNGATPFRVTTDQLSSYSTPYGTFTYSTMGASIARVAISRDGHRIAVGWSIGGDNLGVNAVNVGSVAVRTMTVGTPGNASTISFDSLPLLVTPAYVTPPQSGYPGYPGGGGGTPAQFTTSTGPYHFGDVAADKADGSNAGYLVLSYVRQSTSNQSVPSGTFSTGVFLKGYDWSLNQIFPTSTTELTAYGGQSGATYYSFTELDAYHSGSNGAGWFVLGYNVSGALTAARFNAAGTQLSALGTGSSLPNSSTGWGFSVAARSNQSNAVVYIAAQESSYPDTYGVSDFHQLYVNDTTGNPILDVASGGYPTGTVRYFNPNAVLYDDATPTVAGILEVNSGVMLYRH